MRSGLGHWERLTVAACCSLISTATLLGATASRSDDNRPNIILFITDDQSPMAWPYDGGYRASESFGFCGDKNALSPEVDRLAREGLVFTRAYVSSSVCSPSRYSTLTGRYAGRCTGHSFMALHPPGTMTRVENSTELEADRLNLARVLQKHGYRTGFVGKCHTVRHDVLNAVKRWPDHGLQPYAKGADPLCPEITARMRHNHNRWRAWIAEYGFGFVDAVYAANLRELHNTAADVHNVEWTTDAALRFIERSKDKPFFLYYATTVPHGPAPWWRKKGRYPHGLDADPQMTGAGRIDTRLNVMPSRETIVREVRERGIDPQSAWVRWVDASVGALRAKLEALDLLDNTLIVITSDHGSWRHGKATLHEGGIRLPLVMHWPARIRPGRTYDGLVQNIDFAPTILDLAGVKPPPGMLLDGLSLEPVLHGSTAPLRGHLFCELGYSRGIVTEDWKYIAVRYTPDIERRIAAGESFDGFEGRRLQRPYLTRNGHLGHHASSHNRHYFDPDQLYHLTDDPREESNVADQYPDKLRAMQEQLAIDLRSFDDRPFGEFTKEASPGHSSSARP